MNYTNYERAIVERFGVTLHGWPLSGHVQNPSKVGGSDNVQKLLSALQSETCKWVTLTDTELAKRIMNNKARQALGEEVYKPRRRRAVAREKSIDTDASDTTDE
jgi:hypothetical protein